MSEMSPYSQYELQHRDSSDDNSAYWDIVEVYKNQRQAHKALMKLKDRSAYRIVKMTEEIIEHG
jgi:hypothetical protein